MKKKIASAILAALLCFSIIPLASPATAIGVYTLKQFLDPETSSGNASNENTGTNSTIFTESFTANDSYTVNLITFWGEHTGTSANTTIYLFAANTTGQPIGSPISTGSVNATNPGAPVAWNVTMTPIGILVGNNYCIGFGSSDGTHWIGQNTSSNYTGNASTINSTTYAYISTQNTDYNFRIYTADFVSPMLSSGSYQSLAGGVIELTSQMVIGEANVTSHGFQIGTSSGNYSINQTTNTTLSTSQNFSENISGLTVGQRYYYVAEAYDGQTWTYSNEASFVAPGYITVNHSGIVTNPTFPGYETFIATYSVANWSGNVSFRGYQVGSANGTWDFVSTPLTIDFTGSGYQTTLGGFNNGNTYWYRPYIQGYDTNGNFQTFFGSAANFTENSTAGATVPNVTTVGGAVSQFPITAYHNPVILYSGIVTSSVYPLVQWGFVVSNVSSQVDNISAGGYVLSLLGSNVSPLVFIINNDTMPVGIVYFRAFAMDSHGLVGYGSTLNVTNALPAGTITVNTTSAVVFNGATFFGTVSNPSGVLLSQYGFQWGNASNNLTNASTNTSPNPLFAFNSQFIQFDDNITIYFRAGVRPTGGNWTWSAIDSCTVGVAGNVTLTLPSVTTHLASNTTLNSFTTTIEFTTPVGNNVTEYGIEYRFHNYGSYTTVPAGSGNYTSGNYTAIFAGFTAAQTVYYHAYAINTIGPGYGHDMYVVIGSTQPNGGGSPVTGGKPTQEFSDWMRGVMAGWGMDNTIGHWGFMGIVMLVVFFVFIALIIYLKVQKYGEMIIKIVALFLGVLELAIVGGFVFSGMLDALGVILLVIIGAGVLWGMISGAGKANQSRGEA